jgi:molybdate-binding protein
LCPSSEISPLNRRFNIKFIPLSYSSSTFICADKNVEKQRMEDYLEDLLENQQDDYDDDWVADDFSEL